MISKCLVSGKDINLRNRNLGIIKQITVDRFMEDYDLIEFINPFYLVENWKVNDMFKEKVSPLTFYLVICNEKPDMLEMLFKSLKLLYNTNDITIIDLGKGDFKIMISSNDTPIAFIDDENFIELCDVVLKMLHYEEPEPNKEDDIQGDAELVAIVKKTEAEYAEKHKNKNTVSFEEIVRRVIHMKNGSYEDIKNYTIWQLQDTYRSLIFIENENKNWMLKSSGNFKIDKKSTSWMDETKLMRDNAN